MKELDHIYQYLRSTDGVNQLQRSLPALDPDSIRLDEQKKTDIINFLAKLSNQILFYNLQNQVQGNWSPLFNITDKISTALVRAATDGALNFVSYNNGTKGVNATLTSEINGILPPQDGVALINGDLLLVWQQEAPLQNGVYTVTQGSSSSAFILKRLITSDQKADFDSQIVEATDGLQHSRRLFIQETIAPEIGVSGISYARGELSRSDWPAHQALLLALLQLRGISQQDMNGLTGRHLTYYYEKVLQLQRKPANPDEVHVIFELAKNAASTLLTANTLLDAGKTPDGKSKINYALNSDIVVTHALVSAVKSVFTEKNSSGNRIVFKADDATIVKRDTGTSDWRPFGKAQLSLSPESKTMTEAKLGFAIASPNFLLSEGDRKITISINFDAASLVPPPHAFEVYVTGVKGWLMPFVTVPQFSSSKITFQASIPASFDAIVSYNEPLHGGGFITKFPVLKFEILPYNFQLETLTSFTIGSVDILVEALGVANLVVQNDQSVQAPGKPAMPFGSQPVIGSNFYIGSPEIFNKSIKSLSLKLEWQDPPANFSNYYSAYGNPNITNTVFSTDLYLLAGKNWNTRLLFNQSLFNSLDATSPQLLTLLPSVMDSKLNNSGFSRKADMPVFSEYNTSLSQGFVKLVLTGPTAIALGNLPSSAPFEAFGHKSFTTVYTEKAIALSKFTGGGTPPALPNQPYTPTLKSVTLDYTAGGSFKPSRTNGVDQFFEIDAFGPRELVDYDIARLVPEIPENGALYIGLQDASLPLLLSLLFQVSSGSAPGDTLLTSGEMQWSYLAGNRWKQIAAQEVVENSTNGLQQPGLIRLNIGGDATNDNTVIGNGLHWLRAEVDDHADGAGSLQAIQAQAASATLVLDKNPANSFIQHLSKPLPSSTITKPVHKVSGIKKVIQDYPSFAGLAPETNEVYYQRVSERLRHRNRSVSGWDYERMVLDKFPQVFKVKCLPYTSSESEVTPANIKIVIVPDFRKLTAGNPLQPSSNASLLREISDYINAGFTSPFVKVVAANPVYETLLIDCKVSFLKGFDAGYYSAKLNDELKRFLSAWAYDEGMDITFGGKIYRTELLAFVEGRYYVDYVVDFRVYHRYKGRPDGGISAMTINEDFIISTAPRPTIGVTDATIGIDFVVGQPVEVAKATRPDSILVSNDFHRIKAIQSEDFICSGIKSIGIGQMIIKVDFIVK